MFYHYFIFTLSPSLSLSLCMSSLIDAFKLFHPLFLLPSLVNRCRVVPHVWDAFFQFAWERKKNRVRERIFLNACQLLIFSFLVHSIPFVYVFVTLFVHFFFLLFSFYFALLLISSYLSSFCWLWTIFFFTSFSSCCFYMYVVPLFFI